MENSKGTVLKREGSYYQIKLEDGTHVPNAQNASSVEVAGGDKVVVSYVDSLHNPIITSVFNKLSGDITTEQVKNMIQELKQEIIEDEHPVGSPYFTFLVTDDPNERYPGTRWVRLEGNTYLVSADENIVGMTSVGSNNRDIRIDWQHTHIQNDHNHTDRLYWIQNPTGYRVHAGGTTVGAASGSYTGATIGVDGSNTERNTVIGYTAATNQNAGVQTSNTQTIDNRPNSLAIYLWRRTA
jgi:hypothetical protein